MITHIAGKVRHRKSASVVIDVSGLSYEVMIPPVVMRSLDAGTLPGAVVEFEIFHYYQMDQTKAVPVLIGFANEVEKEFFELFITVSGVGPKAACKALAQPFSIIADAIDRGDMPLLKTLPGIGEQKAREIIAKLQGKVGKFGLIQDRSASGAPSGKEDVKEEALHVLTQLQYKKAEASEMIERALKRNPKLATCEEILNEVYRGAKR